jgi:hypothetical protein
MGAACAVWFASVRPYEVIVDPGSDTNCRVPPAQTRPAADRRIRFLSEKVVSF